MSADLVFEENGEAKKMHIRPLPLSFKIILHFQFPIIFLKSHIYTINTMSDSNSIGSDSNETVFSPHALPPPYPDSIPFLESGNFYNHNSDHLC
jgi:hypothetical protein